MSSTLLDEVKKHRQEIKHEVLTYAISELVTMHAADPQEIKIQPEWQRLFRWSREQQSAFIESLILEIPVPPLFFFEAEDGRWELLDGLQRVSTIIKFMGPATEDVPVQYQGPDANDDDWHEAHREDITIPLQLVGTDYLPSLEGLSFARLPMSLRLNLKRARVQIYVLKRETHRVYKYEVFKRLNRGGSLLEEQELRNCAVRILGDKFPAYIKELGSRQEFLNTLSLSRKDRERAYADELALRFLTMKNYGERHFSHDVAALLTHYMEQVAKGAVAFDYEAELGLFRDVWRAISAVPNASQLFRAQRQDGGYAGGKLSPTIYELVSLSVAWNLVAARRLTPEELGKHLQQLVQSARDSGLTGSGSNSKVKTMGRLARARGAFS